MKCVTLKAGFVFIARFLLSIAIMPMLAPSLFGQQSGKFATSEARTPADNAAPLNPQLVEKLVIGPGDLLIVSVFGVPELQQTLRVSETGDAVLSLIGNLHVAGMTVAAAETSIEDEYRGQKLLVDPHVSILVTEYATEGVSVLGEVARPGVYPLLGPHTLLNIISAAGGLTGSAGSSVSIRRRDGAEQAIQLDANNPKKSLSEDVELQPADMVIISRAAIVYVVGDVSRPGGFPMQNNGKLTVLQALALASGVNKTAALSHAKIIHKAESGYQETDIHLAKLMQGKAPDMPLSPEDIVFVPNSKLKSAVAGGYSSVVAAATSAAIYSVRP